jgi:hypothetical protein
MAFNLFPKPPVKGKAADAKPRPEPGARPDPRSPPGSARELATTMKVRPAAPSRSAARPSAVESEREITVTGPPSLIEWTPGLNQKIQVAEANPGLCAVLENAALLYANGQAAQARLVL